jgi:hypothetical protein
MEKILWNQSLIYNDFRQETQRIYSASVTLWTGDLQCLCYFVNGWFTAPLLLCERVIYSAFVTLWTGDLQCVCYFVNGWFTLSLLLCRRVIYIASVTLWTADSDVSDLSSAKVGFHCFPSLYHQNNGLETTSIFLFDPLQLSSPKKRFLGRMSNGRVSDPPCKPKLPKLFW